VEAFLTDPVIARLRNGAVISYVAAMVLSDDGLVRPGFEFNDDDDRGGNPQHFAAELCAAGLLVRVHNDQGEVVAYRVELCQP